MPNHMSDIGFHITSPEEDFRNFAHQAIEFGQLIGAKNGHYFQWVVGNGIELWVQRDSQRNIIGLNPHFSGSARMRVSITERIPRHEHSILDGAFYGWADPRSEDPESGEFPFVFDLPDYDLHNSLQLPVAANVQIAAFAHHLNGFANEEAYLASQREGRKFAPESFIPSGLFTPDGKVTEPPQAYSIFSGHVLDTAVINNPATNHEFYWAKVRTLGGEIDVVADPQIVKGSIVKDGIVRGTFWLSGRLA